MFDSSFQLAGFDEVQGTPFSISLETAAPAPLILFGTGLLMLLGLAWRRSDLSKA